MNTMTTNEAAKLAAHLLTQGKMSGREIGKALARQGYYSFRTGKPLSAGGAVGLARSFINGETIVDRKPRKHAKFHQKRLRNTELKRLSRERLRQQDEKELGFTRQDTSPTPPPPPRHVHEDHEEIVARSVMKRAIETMVLKMFGAKVVVLLPTDVTFR